jgi:hypothetical protein
VTVRVTPLLNQSLKRALMEQQRNFCQRSGTRPTLLKFFRVPAMWNWLSA